MKIWTQIPLAIAHAHQISAAKVAQNCDTVRMGWTLPESQKAIAQVSDNEHTCIGVDADNAEEAGSPNEDGCSTLRLENISLKKLGQGEWEASTVFMIQNSDAPWRSKSFTVT